MNSNSNFNNSIGQARTLVRAFMAGATDPAQEQWLYRFFGTCAPGSLPPDLEAMRPMFGWYASLRKPAQPARRRNHHLLAVAAAAVVLLAVGVFAGLMLSHRRAASIGAYTEYSGSYIIRNGQRCDQMAIIYNDIVTAERFADSLASTPDDSLAIEQALQALGDDNQASELRQQIFY